MSATIDKAYVRIEEGQLHLRTRAGGSDALPLVMLHASPASSGSLLPLMEVLDPARPLFAFDTPCNGHSCPPAIDQPKVADFANQLARGATAKGLDALVLYGTHTGAHIAIEWALARPDQVKAVVLDGIALLDDATRVDFLACYAPRKAPDVSGMQFQWAWNFIRDQMIFFPHYKKDSEHIRMGGSLDPQLLHLLTLDVLNNLEDYHKPYEAVFRHDARNALKRLMVPTLVLGDNESALDPSTAEIAGLVPDARTVLKCATPESKARAIETFLTELQVG